MSNSSQRTNGPNCATSGAGRATVRPLFMCTCRRIFDRSPEHDRRFSRGDDFAGDCWQQRGTGRRFYSVPNYTPMRCWICSGGEPDSPIIGPDFVQIEP